MSPSLSAVDVSALVLCAFFLAAAGGWLFGASVYFFCRARNRGRFRMRPPQLVALGLVSGLVVLVSIPFAPFVLLSGYSAWWRHKTKEIRRDKIEAALRSIREIRTSSFVCPPSCGQDPGELRQETISA